MGVSRGLLAGRGALQAVGFREQSGKLGEYCASLAITFPFTLVCPSYD